MQDVTGDGRTYHSVITNGVPHLSYFDAETHTSFTWSGNNDDWIEVSTEYGEPVQELIPVPLALRTTRVQSPADVLVVFREVCDSYTKAPTSTNGATR